VTGTGVVCTDRTGSGEGMGYLARQYHGGREEKRKRKIKGKTSARKKKRKKKREQSDGDAPRWDPRVLYNVSHVTHTPPAKKKGGQKRGKEKGKNRKKTGCRGSRT